jgi:MarR family 2-MHQ and catechol resistance regulon transcriptional repressor
MDTSGTHTWLVLWKAFEAVQAYALEDISSLGMCMSDFSILEILLHKGPLPSTDIARRVSLTPGSMTTAIDRLEERGLVERQPSKNDRRSRLVALTPAGRKLIQPAFQRHCTSLEKVAAPLSKKDRETLITLLKKFGMSAQEGLTERRSAAL